MGNIAIIPARGGSKRLSRKNILPLGGVPLIGRVIRACLETNIFDRVIVSTEDEEIAHIAKTYGASIHNRSESLAADTSKVVEVCVDVLKSADCETFCCVYATAALLKPNTIKASYSIFSHSKESNCLMGVSKYNYSPVQALKVNDDDTVKLLMPEYEKTQSQFYPKIRVSNGTLYWGRKQSFLEDKTFYCSSLKVFDIPNNEVCDIDTMDDYNKLVDIFNESSL
jgi:pseudaminic acid cytidylyltransferase